MLSSSQEGERISFPVLEKEEGEARVPFSFETECASYFPAWNPSIQLGLWDKQDAK